MKEFRLKTSKVLIKWASQNFLDKRDILYAIASCKGLEGHDAGYCYGALSLVLAFEQPPIKVTASIKALLKQLKRLMENKNTPKN